MSDTDDAQKTWQKQISVKVPDDIYDILYREALLTHGGFISPLVRDILKAHVARRALAVPAT